MNRRGLSDTRTNLGESTSCLLTFQHDMLESPCYRSDEDIDNSFCKMSLTSMDNPRSSTAYRQRDDDVVQSSCGRPRSSTACRVRNDEGAQKRSGNPRSFTAQHSRCEDAPKLLSRIKSGSEVKIFEMKPSRSNSVAPSHKKSHDSDNTSTTSVSTATESTLPSRANNREEIVDSKPREYHRLRQPPGRSRPGIRTHRSGSFALRQFKENYDQKQNRRSKTKAEARLQDSLENEVTETTRSIDSVSENSEQWSKPALRPYRSVDGSFRIQGDAKSLYGPVETSIVAKNDVILSRSRGSDQRSMEFDGGMKFKRSVIEVAPGCSMLFSGIDETMNALHLDRIVHAECTSCNTFLACINVASMVLCPGCQTVSPLDSASHSFDCVPIMGLGLRVEDILAHVGK
jgi:hypothetical protein